MTTAAENRAGNEAGVELCLFFGNGAIIGQLVQGCQFNLVGFLDQLFKEFPVEVVKLPGLAGELVGNKSLFPAVVVMVMKSIDCVVDGLVERLLKLFLGIVPRLGRQQEGGRPRHPR